MELKSQWDLVYKWFCGRLHIILTTATSVLNATGVNEKKCKSLSYKSFLSAIRQVAHNTDISIFEFNKLPDLFIDEHSDKE